jgi:rubrerythrin
MSKKVNVINPDSAEPEKKEYECPACGETFTAKKKPSRCPYCGVEFA